MKNDKQEKEIQPGFFTMDLIKEVCAMTDLSKAKQLCVEAVNAKTSAKAENKAKALSMINRSTSIQKLGLSLTSFFFAHPSEGLKTL